MLGNQWAKDSVIFCTTKGGGQVELHPRGGLHRVFDVFPERNR